MKNIYPLVKIPFLKYLSLALLLFSTCFTSCKSSLEDELAPATTQKITPAQAPVVDSAAPADTTAKGGGTATTDTTTTKPATSSNNSSSIVNATLKSSFAFPIGAAVDMDRLKGSTYNTVVAREFSSVTAESSMKFGAIHPSLNVYNFVKADAIVAFAAKNNMRVHGHTLIWAKDSVQPKWLMDFQGDEAAWDALLKSHIQTVVKHFKGKVVSWDVVNEPYADNGTLKDNIWLRKLGPEYLTKAFFYAHEADPSALLFLNDYGQEFGGKKMAAILNFVASAKKCNMPINGLGFQMHTVLRINVNGLRTNVAKAVDAGMMIHFSELDISVRYQQAKNFDLNEALEIAQAAKFKEIVQVYLSIPKSLQFGITTWGVSDADTFMNQGQANLDHDYPLLFNKQYKPKAAYASFIAAGQGK